MTGSPAPDPGGERRRKMDGTRWALRTIRRGTVRFYGKTYQVAPTERAAPYESDPPYDGRLDGMRAHFYNYDPHCTSLADSVFLHSVEGAKWPGPNCIDGYFRWERWTEVGA